MSQNQTPESPETPAEEKNLVGIVSHDLLAVLEDAFGLDQLEERWKPYGYTVETAMQAKAAYEGWAKEELHFDCLDEAVCGTNKTGGDFPVRLEAFFAGRISSANAGGMARGLAAQDPESPTNVNG